MTHHLNGDWRAAIDSRPCGDQDYYVHRSLSGWR